MLCFGWNKTAAQTGPYWAQSLGCIIPVEAFLSFFFFSAIEFNPSAFLTGSGRWELQRSALCPWGVTVCEMSLRKSLSVQWCKQTRAEVGQTTAQKYARFLQLQAVNIAAVQPQLLLSWIEQV